MLGSFKNITDEVLVCWYNAKVSDLFSTRTYSFELPESLIAAEPLARRDASRLLVVHRSSHTIEHRRMTELPQILSSDYEMVVNNTRVFRARLMGERLLDGGKRGGKVEFFMLKRQGLNCWQGLMKTGARVAPGFEFTVQGISAKVIAREDTPSGALMTAEFSRDPLEAQIGEVPLPPYILAQRLKQASASEAGASIRTPARTPARTSGDELEIYNTTYAREAGSVAAPTAGRHFTPELIRELQDKGIGWHEVTLHVGIGTFKPVSVDDVRNHDMHAETAQIPPAVADALNLAKKRGKKILAVGTTTTRTLEGMSHESPDGAVLDSGTQDVNLFIHPAADAGRNYRWKYVDAMLTNFHLPESTLLMMVSSFVGDVEWVREIYQEAIRERYRFYSYGDAMLIL